MRAWNSTPGKLSGFHLTLPRVAGVTRVRCLLWDTNTLNKANEIDIVGSTAVDRVTLAGNHTDYVPTPGPGTDAKPI